jgi:glutamate formiminotransferase/formiminotetrahydrofolate cyclodeaminase
MLVAYNINLDTKDVSIAKNIAELVRESGKVVTDRYGKRERIPGRFRSVKGLGWYIKDFDCVQVSYNLTDLDNAGMLDVFLATKEEAEKLQCTVTGSELVGLASVKELTKAGNYFNGGIPSTEKDLIKSAVQSMGLDQFHPFKAEKKLIEYLIAT